MKQKKITQEVMFAFYQIRLCILNKSSGIFNVRQMDYSEKVFQKQKTPTYAVEWFYIPLVLDVLFNKAFIFLLGTVKLPQILGFGLNINSAITSRVVLVLELLL